jgi:hypothetical protein
VHLLVIYKRQTNARYENENKKVVNDVQITKDAYLYLGSDDYGRLGCEAVLLDERLSTFLSNVVLSSLNSKGPNTLQRAPYTLKGPIHSKGPHRLQVKLCKFKCVKKTARKTELNVLWHSTGFPSSLSVFLSVLCAFLCV